MSHCRILAGLMVLLWCSSAQSAEPERVQPLPEGWDYAPAMKKVAAKFKGTEGVVLHGGGSMTIVNPYA